MLGNGISLDVRQMMSGSGKCGSYTQQNAIQVLDKGNHEISGKWMELKANYTRQGDSGSNRQRLHVWIQLGILLLLFYEAPRKTRKGTLEGGTILRKES